MLYFSYGSNLNEQDRRRWCQDGSLDPGPMRLVSTAWLPDHAVAFDYRSASRGGGVLDVIERRGAVVPGALFEVSEEGLRALDAKEGVGARAYRRKSVVVLTDDGTLHRAITYEVVRKCELVAPTSEYMGLVTEALASLSLDSSHIVEAAAGRVEGCDLDAVFVYGTLLRGESRHPAIAAHTPSSILLGKAPGRLLDLGDFPGLLAGSERGWVAGELVRVPRIASLLRELDPLEGFRGFSTERASLFRRALIDVDVGEGRSRRAWVYRYDGDALLARAIASGDYREHRGVRDRVLQELVAGHVGDDERATARRILDAAYRTTQQVDDLLPLASALADGRITERLLAQVSGRWAVGL